MKSIWLIWFLLFFFFTLQSFAQCFDWGAEFGDQNFVSVVADENNNVYASGSYDSTSLFGTQTLSTLPYANGIFLTKYDANSNFMWAKNICLGDAFFYLKSLAISGNSLYITGGCSSGLTINGVSYPGNSIYLIKTDFDGTIIWSRAYPSNTGSGSNQGLALISDNQNGIFLTGRFRDSVNFDNYHLYANGGQRMFLTRINSSGSVLWAIQAANTAFSGGTSSRGACVNVSANGNVIVGGFYTDSLRFGNHLAPGPFADYKSYIAAFDSNGNNIWINAGIDDPSMINPSNFANTYGVITDASNNIYAAISNEGDSLRIGSIEITKNIVLVKYDQSGNVIWVSQQGHTNPFYVSEWGPGILTDAAGNIYNSGQVWDSAYFDQNMILTNGSISTFIAKYNSSGTLENLLISSGAGSPYHYQSCIDNSDNIYIGGLLYGSEETISSITTANPDTSHAVSFIWKLCNSDFSGIENLQTKNVMLIFPNPATDWLIVKFDGNVSIVSLEGHVMIKENNHQQDQSIDVSHFPNGIYLCYAGNKCSKIAIQH